MGTNLSLESINRKIDTCMPLQAFRKTSSLLLCLFLVQLLYAQTLSWSILETEFDSYEEARAFIETQDNQQNVFSLLYTPEYLVYGSTADTPLEHPMIAQSWTLAELENAKHIPVPLRRFFEELYEEDERFDPQGRLPQADHHHQTQDLDKGLDEVSYPNQWNSERMVGLMTCNVFFVESDGSVDPNYFTWTAKALLEEKVTILRSLHTWSYTAFRYGIDLTFIPQWLDRSPALGQGREPNLHFGSFEMYSGQVLAMNKAVLANLGYDEGFYTGDEFNFDQKRLTAADGSFTIGVHYDHAGRGRIRAHAYLGGPYTFLSSRSNFSLYGHEIGHIFHAFDEYLNSDCEFNSNTTFNGIINKNNIGSSCEGKQACVMVNNVTAGSGPETYYALCEYTVAHIGWAGDLATKPLITHPSQDTSFAFYLQDFRFHFPPGGAAQKSAVIKIWREDLGRPELVFQEVFPLESETLNWYNDKIKEPGDYRMVVQHGQPYRYALADSEPLYFTIMESPTLPYPDTCIWYCGDLQPISLGVEGLKWYSSSSLQEVLFTGDDYLPSAGGTYYAVLEAEGQPQDVTQVVVSENFPVSAQLLQTFTSTGPIHLYLQSFTGIPHARAFKWYKEGALIATTQIPGLDVMEEGNYQVIIDNGCESSTNILFVQRAPIIELVQDCQVGGYTFTADRLVSLANFNGEEFYVTDSVFIPASEDFVELQVYSPDGSLFWNVYELVPLEQQTFLLENLDGFLRFKSEEPYETVSWYRNDTLVLESRQEWFIVDRPGQYQAKLNHGARLCPIVSQVVGFNTLIPPPTIDQQQYILCLSEVGELPTLQVDGQNIRWYLEPQKEEQIAEGNSFQPSIDYYRFSNHLYVTQEVDGQQSSPLVIQLVGLAPLEVSIDTFDQTLLAIVNGIHPNYLPGDYQYDWAYDESFLASTVIPSYPLGDPGTYQVTLNNQQPACLLSEAFILEGTVTSTDDASDTPTRLQLYPNPVRENIWLRIGEGKVHTVQIFNLNGQLLRQYPVNGLSTIQVPAKGLLPGFYLAVIQTQDGRQYPVKFVKE